MRLIKFEYNTGAPVWVNPDQVAAVGRTIYQSGVVDITFQGDENNYIVVKGTPEKVVYELLNYSPGEHK